MEILIKKYWKITLILFIVIIFTSFSINAQTSVFMESMNRYQNDEVIPTLLGGSSTPINEKWSHGSFFLLTNGWGEVSYGFTYKINPNFNLGFKIGVEQYNSKISPRFSPSIFLKKDKLSFFGIFEQGIHKDSHWWTAHLLWTEGKTSFGLMSKRFSGHGIQVKQKLGNHFGIWGAVVYDEKMQVVKPILAFSLNF